MSLFLLVAGMFALPVMFAGGLFVASNFGPFFGIDLGLDKSGQSTASASTPDAAPASRPQEPSRSVRKAA